MTNIVVWILVAVSSSGTGRSEFAVPAFSPPLSSAADCQKLMEAAQRVVGKSDGRNKGPAMECIAVQIPFQNGNALAKPEVKKK
jgi:hypothetical protein